MQISAGHFHKSVHKSANCRLKVLICGLANRFLTANICGKKLKSTANLQTNNIAGMFLYNLQKSSFYSSMYTQCRVDVGLFLKYNTLLPNSAAMEQLLSMGHAIFTAKQTSSKSRNF